MKVSANPRSTGVSVDRQVSLTVTALNNNDYSRTADLIMNVPFSRMGQTMHLVQCMGGKITAVHVTGAGATTGGSQTAAPRKSDKKHSA